MTRSHLEIKAVAAPARVASSTHPTPSRWRQSWEAPRSAKRSPPEMVDFNIRRLPIQPVEGSELSKRIDLPCSQLGLKELTLQGRWNDEIPRAKELLVLVRLGFKGLGWGMEQVQCYKRSLHTLSGALSGSFCRVWAVAFLLNLLALPFGGSGTRHFKYYIVVSCACIKCARFFTEHIEENPKSHQPHHDRQPSASTSLAVTAGRSV